MQNHAQLLFRALALLALSTLNPLPRRNAVKAGQPAMHWLLTLLLCAASGACVSTAHAQGTAFTYQGRLNSGGAAANGIYDFRFKLYVDPLGNTQAGSLYATNGIGVTNGLFLTTIDFGPGLFTGSNYWLEVDVRTNGAGTYTVLSPLQALLPTPYAIFANSASNLLGILPAVQLSGMVANGNLPSSPTVSGTVTAGSFSGNGGNVTNVNAAALNGLNATNFWQLGGNTVAAGQFLGSINKQPVEIWAAGQRALRLEPNTNNYDPNVIAGSPLNYVAPGVEGATISGGGATNTFSADSNSVTANYGTIGGGEGNIAGGGYDATVGGGLGNVANSTEATVGGGLVNTAGNYVSTVAGGYRNNASGPGAFIGGGGYYPPFPSGNYASGYDSVIGGGDENFASGDLSVVLGGLFNHASGALAIVGGGNDNSASGQTATIGGGVLNSATNTSATVPGGTQNIAGGQNSFAAGQQAQAIHDGAFVWADEQNTNFTSTSSNQFLIRAQNGVGINTNNPGTSVLNVAGNADVSGLLISGTGMGTSDFPSPSGVVVRRINSYNSTSGQIVARTDTITLMRDGTDGGFLVQIPAGSGNVTIACMGIDNTGAQKNFYVGLASSGSSVGQYIYTDSQHIVHFECTFGVTFFSGQHLTQVTLSRYANGVYLDNFWSGTLISTYNQ